MKKLTKSLLLTALILTTMSISAFAWQSSYTTEEGGTHTYGVSQPGNGSEMAFSYYYHPTLTHTSSVTYDGKLYTSGAYAPGRTSIANGPSVPSGTVTFHWYYNN